jgi:hypothetical protein
MARTYLVFGDIDGKLDVLRVECTKCPRKGRYSVPRLIEKYGRKASMMKWKEQLHGDCPKRDAHQLHDRCDLICPDLPTELVSGEDDHRVSLVHNGMSRRMTIVAAFTTGGAITAISRTANASSKTRHRL